MCDQKLHKQTCVRGDLRGHVLPHSLTKGIYIQNERKHRKGGKSIVKEAAFYLCHYTQNSYKQKT